MKAVKLVDYRLHGSATHLAVDPDDPHHVFTREDVLERLKSQTVNHYSGIYNVMKGATLAAAGVAMVSVMVEHLPFERAVLLVVAFLAVIISYNGATVGQTIVHLHPSALDVILPMALTIAELIVVSLPGFDTSTHSLPSDWLPALGVWQIMAGLVILSIITRLEPAFYRGQLWGAVKGYRERLVFDWKCATGGGFAVLAYWLLTRVFPAWPGWDYATYLLLGLLLIFFSKAIAHHGETRRELVTSLLRIPSKPTEENTPQVQSIRLRANASSLVVRVPADRPPDYVAEEGQPEDGDKAA